MADNLESYFKKNLSEETPAEDNWNVPSDAVWDNVLPEIQKRRGLFIPLRYFYLLGGLILAALLFFFLWPDSPVESKPAKQNLQAKLENVNLPTAVNSDQKVADEQKKDDPLASEKAKHPNQTVKKNEIAKSVFASPQGISPAVKTNLNQSETTFYKDKNNPITPGKDDVDASLNSVFDKEINGIAYLHPRPVYGFVDVDKTDQPKPTSTIPLSPIAETQEKKSEPFDNKGKIGLGAFFAPTMTSTCINGDLSTGEMKAGNMFLYSGNWGFELKYHISNRFAILTGVEKSEIKSWSKSLVDFAYDVSGEHEMETGEKENTSAVPMPTPFGEIDTEITYRFPGEQQIPDGEMMQSVLETHQEVRYFSIPLGVEFNIIRFSRFSWFAEAGLRYNRALKDATQFSSRIIHEGDEMQVVAEEMTSHPSFTENYLNFYIGTGLNYQFSKSFQINASARYFGNITHVNLQDNMSTYVQGFSLKIGIVYLF